MPVKPAKQYKVFIDTFSGGLEDLPKSDHGSVFKVLTYLAKNPRFSTFEVDVSKAMQFTISHLFEARLIRDLGEGYPWHRVSITKAGKALLAQGNFYPHIKRRKTT